MTHLRNEGKVVRRKRCFPSVHFQLMGLRRGTGNAISWTHFVVKHKMIPAYCCEGGGAIVKPAHTFDIVLVPPVSESTNKYVISIFNRTRN